jgi:DNA-binding NarL/FixJ family response regulator
VFTSVAIVSQSGEELQAIRQCLKNPVAFTVREFLSIADVNQGLKLHQFDVLIMRVPRFEIPHVKMVFKVRSLFPKAGLITVTSEINPNAQFQVKDVCRHKLLREPIEIEDLPSVVAKLARGEESLNRQHPRVTRGGECELYDRENNVRLKARFVDFAQMGTRLLVHPRTPLKRGSKYELHYKSTTEQGRLHRIQSNVVWAEVSSGMVGTIFNGPQQMIGLRFIAAL